ncbi:MAG: NUDIX domain-containing protein [Anaerolineae bacterium]|nr:NUDIX domain-containing protein [Anaerolineae bacterium]
MSDVIHRQSVSAIPLNPMGKILLQQRDDRPKYYPNCWTTFGGAVEAGETPDEGMRRELLEEIELELPMKLWKVQEILVERDGQQIAWENTIYVGYIDRAASEIKLNEGQALGYFGLDDLDKLQIGFDFEPLFREFFAALADGILPL